MSCRQSAGLRIFVSWPLEVLPVSGKAPVMAASLSIIIPAVNAAIYLPACLDALVGASIDGHVREVIISDGASDDRTEQIAKAYGARVISGAQGRGDQLARGVDAARGDWFLFLHADTVLSPEWVGEAEKFMMRGEKTAGVFRLRFAPSNMLSEIVAGGAMIRTRMFKLPYGDQGLLISRSLYDQIGGFRRLPLFEDVDIIDRLTKAYGRAAVTVLDATAETSAAKYIEQGYFLRVIKNFFFLIMYRVGIAPERIYSWYIK